MISDEHFNALKWQPVTEVDLEILQGAFIEGLEPIWAGYADDNGDMIINGLVLYITARSGDKMAITLEAPEIDLLPEQLVINSANLLKEVGV